MTRPLDGPPNWERASLHRVVAQEGRILVGRKEGDFLVPGDPYLSGQHVTIRREGSYFHLVDLGSRNGTYIRVRGSRGLVAGDTVMAGSQVFRIREWRRTDLIGQTPPAGMVDPVDVASVPAGGRSRSGDDPPRLSLVRLADGGAEAEVFPVPDHSLTLGRTEGDIVFPEDALLSDPHASLHPSSEPTFPLFVKDEDSRNGVYVRVRQSCVLEAGDMFTVGRQLFIFQPRDE